MDIYTFIDTEDQNYEEFDAFEDDIKKIKDDLQYFYDHRIIAHSDDDAKYWDIDAVR